MTHTRTSSTLFVGLLGALALSLVLALPAQADTGSSTATSTSERGKKTINLSCVQTAVETRETALVEAWDAFAEAIHDGLDARKSALKAAWGITDKSDRNKAIVAAWKEWRTDSKDAHKELRSDRKAAWDTYKKTMRSSCKVDVPKDEALGQDAAGEVAL